MKKFHLQMAIALALALLGLSGCSTLGSNTAGGVVLGAVGGGAIGALAAGGAPPAIATGAGIGAIMGGAVGNSVDRRIAEERAQATQVQIAVQPVVHRHWVAPVTFAFNSAKLDPRFYPTLNNIADRLAQEPDATIIIQGHADQRGTHAYNLHLSKRRAQAVADYLAARGVDRDRLKIASCGKRRLAARGDDSEAHAQNRRVEIIIQ